MTCYCHVFYLTGIYILYLHHKIIIFLEPSMIRLTSALTRKSINFDLYKAKCMGFSHKTWRLFSSDNLNKTFHDHASHVARLKEDPGNEAKLKLYALFKQATVGPCNTPSPGAFDMVGKYKWTVWNNLGQMSKEEAMKNYIEKVKELMKTIGVKEEATFLSSSLESSAASDSVTTSLPNDNILLTNREGVMTIKLNRPAKRNALTSDMYETITDILTSTANDDRVKLLLFTGEGHYFSSGNDFSKYILII